MKREEAIHCARLGLAREHRSAEIEASYAHRYHDAIALVDALENLGLLKFDEYKFDASSTEPGRATQQKTGSHFRNQLSERGLDRHEVESIINGLKPAEVLARVLLGAPFSQWLVGFGPNGADRLIHALKDAGFQIGRGLTVPDSKQAHLVAAQTIRILRKWRTDEQVAAAVIEDLTLAGFLIVKPE